MPDRRPYASRGIAPRPPRRGSSSGGLALLALVIVIGISVAWLTNFASSPQVVPNASTPATSARTPDPLTMSNVDPTAIAQPGQAAPVSESTLRQWDTRAAGIAIDPALVARLDQALVGVDGHAGIAVKDLGSGRGAVLDGDLELQSASLYKLPVLYTTFAEGLSMSEPLPITEDALSYDTGTMELGVGETLSVAEALERMVTISDNTSAIVLASRLGAGRINSAIANLGMDTTHYSLERMTTSALDMLRMLELLANGNAVSPSASADMVHLMLRQRVNDRLPRLVPDDVQVAHKTGNLPGTVNDVGILYGPTSTLAIAALISDTTDETAAAAGIARVAQAAYSYFDEQPEVTARPLVPAAPSRPIPPVWRQPRPPTPIPIATPTVAPTEPVAVEAPTEPTEVDPTATPLALVVHSTPTAPAATAQPTAPPTEKPTATPLPPALTPTPVPPQPTATPQPAPTKVPARPPAPTSTPTKH